jgi:hypothetical protein
MQCGESWKGEFSTPHIPGVFLCKLVAYNAEKYPTTVIWLWHCAFWYGYQRSETHTCTMFRYITRRAGYVITVVVGLLHAMKSYRILEIQLLKLSTSLH